MFVSSKLLPMPNEIFSLAFDFWFICFQSCLYLHILFAHVQTVDIDPIKPFLWQNTHKTDISLLQLQIQLKQKKARTVSFFSFLFGGALQQYIRNEVVSVGMEML